MIDEEKEKKRTRRDPKPPMVEESNSIGANAGDHTSGVPLSPEEWAAEQPLSDEPTFPMDAGDPSPYQPTAGTPEEEDK